MDKKNISLETIRKSERESHEKLYNSNELYEPGSWLAKPVETVIDYLKFYDNHTDVEILDLGSGVGRNSIAIAQYFKERDIACNVDCVDLLEAAINRLKENAIKYGVQNCITPILSSIDSFDIAHKKYDYIVSVSAIEHVASRELFKKTLHSIRQATKSNGTVCLILNTELHERKVENNEEQDALFEVNLPTNEMVNLLESFFEGWSMIKKTVVHQEWITPREDGDVKLDTNVVTWVCRKQSLEWIVEPLLSWYKKQARVLPWRENRNPYRVWVSEIMLQQTRVEAVIAYFHRFMESFPNIQALAEAEEETVLKLWEGLGYYSRARNLKKAAEIICEKYDGEFPKDYKDILALPGIGKYTAGAISSIAFGMPRAAVDENVLRVITRLHEMGQDIQDEKFRKQMGVWLEEIYPKNHCSEFTQSLMELGAMVCVPNGAPKCESCPLNVRCQAFKNDTWQKYPVKKEKAKRKIIDKTVLILCNREKIAVQKRKEKGLLAGMWEFPNVDKKMDTSEIEVWLQEQNIDVVQIEKQKDVKHIFTHLEWNMHCYKVECRPNEDLYAWVAMEDLNREIPLPTAFRKCL